MPDDESYKNALTEWQEARATISKCEECLDGLRRYGFTVIAGLLAVDAIQSYINLGNPAKIGLIVITIAFIIGLYLLDVYYQRIIEAATIRARILETTVLNFELNETLSERFEHEGLKTYIKWIYIGFILIAVLIGIMVVISAVPSPLTTSINSSINTTSSNSGIPSNNSTFVNSTSTNIIDSGTLLTNVTNTSTSSTNVTNTNTSSTDETNTNTSSTTIENSSIRSTTEATYKDWSLIQKNDKKGILLFISVISFFIFLIITYVIMRIKSQKTDNKSQKADNNRIISPTIISSIYVFLFMSLVTFVFVTIAYYITPNLNYEINIVSILIFIIAIIGGIGAYVINLFSEISINTLKSERLELPDNSGDWIIDRVSCRINEKVKITITNLDEKLIEFALGDTFCDIESNDGKYKLNIKIEKITIPKVEKITIPKYGTYSLLWDTSKPGDTGTVVEEGIYRIKPRGFHYPLRRVIVVSGSAKQEELTVTKGNWTVTKGEGEFTVSKNEENRISL